MTPRESRALVIVGGLAVGGLVALGVQYAAVAVLALTVVVLALQRPYLLALGLVGWTAVRGPVMQAVPAMATAANVAEAGVLVIVLLIAGKRLRRGHWLLEARWPWVFLLLWALSALVSAAVNGSSLLQVVMGFRGHLLVPLAATAAALLVDSERDRQLAVGLAVLVVLAQVPVGILQFLTPEGATRGPDIVYGTLGVGGHNNLGFLMLGGMAAFASEYVRTRRLPYMLAVIACAPVFIFASARFALLLSPLVLFGSLLFARPEEGRGLGLSRRSVLAVIALASAIALVGLYYEYRPTTVSRELSPEYFLIDQGTFIERGVSRAGYLYYGQEFLMSHAPVPAVGTGPASAASGAADNINGPLAYEFLYGLQLFGRSNTFDPSRPGYVPLPPELPSNLVEYGPVGTGLFMGFAVSMGIVILRRLRRERVPGLAPVPYLMWFGLYTAGTAYTSSWEGFSIVAVGFWWWTIALSSGRRRTR